MKCNFSCFQRIELLIKLRYFLLDINFVTNTLYLGLFTHHKELSYKETNQPQNSYGKANSIQSNNMFINNEEMQTAIHRAVICKKKILQCSHKKKEIIGTEIYIITANNVCKLTQLSLYCQQVTQMVNTKLKIISSSIFHSKMKVYKYLSR